MAHRHLSRAVLGIAIAVAGTLTLGVTTASAGVDPNQDLINKMSGGRLALHNDATGEGNTAITLRSPSWKYSTEAWDADSTWSADETGTWTTVYRNRAANKCLQPASASAERGTTIVVRTCDGSDLQKWILRGEKVDGRYTGWWMWRPKVNRNVAIALNRYNDGSWDTLHLDTAYPSSDRLWRIAPNDAAWNLD
ncbi:MULTISPECIES: RICIN domain-containing protein [unclassified Streptomyces]|uniref:RICIN domain-containing protein n=1 Tax=unclassified Streptomyces TaxID=2593676 RepID=UPI0036E62643